MGIDSQPPENLELQRKPLKEEIFDILHKRIIAGKYSPGEWLRQEDIASSLNVSQTPVREALDLLVSAGLAERVPFRGVRVLQLSPEEMVDAYGLRLLLEPAAVRCAAERATPNQIQALERLLEQMKPLVTLNDISAQRQLNRQFHLEIVRLGGNPLLEKVYEMAANAFPDWMLYEAMFHHPEMLESCLQQEYQEHVGLLDAIAAHQPEGAAGQALAHILTVGQEMETLLGIPGESLRDKERQYISQPASGKG